MDPSELLSLRFNHEEFCDGLYLHRKTLGFAVFTLSGAPLEGRIALAALPESRPPLGLPGDLPQGFGAFAAGVPRSTKSDEATRWTRTGVRADPHRNGAPTAGAGLPHERALA